MGNKRKRDKGHQPPWISVYRHTWNSPAWKHLSVGARATYVELAANYNTKRKNAVYIAARKGAKQLGVHKDYITQWLRELEHYGFIIKVCGPHLGLDGEARATRYRLTDRWYGDKPATYDLRNGTACSSRSKSASTGAAYRDCMPTAKTESRPGHHGHPVRTPRTEKPMGGAAKMGSNVRAPRTEETTPSVRTPRTELV